ncbi:hypothetical protein [Microbulbifer agarilyticus]|uniref:hypothetical protein n=1 Tax=Microbulbifer agarilyticus TaxID=260552 RepID=UPI001CD4E687|nr:hypothetical protein [Microbulbifer agarilyticus]MCA0901476.1 hypothetical protein [Microbulbifer agarilyticus]
MRQIPYRLLAALTITLTLGGCVTYPAATPVIVEQSYVRKAPPVYSYSVITDPGYRYYDDTLGVYVFYDRSDVFYREGRYYRWYRDHWISASHWGGRWYPAPNFYISANFNDRWHTRLRRHGQRYAGGHQYRPPRRHVHDHSYKQRDRHDGNPYRHDRREEGRDRREEGRDRREERQDRGRDGVQGFAGVPGSKRRVFQADSQGGDRRNERRNPRLNPSRNERVVNVAGKPAGIRDPHVVPAVDRSENDRRAVRDRLKPQSQRAQPQHQPQRKASNDRRNTAAQPAPRQEREQPKNEQPKKKEKESKKKTDKHKQVRLVHDPRTRRSNEARRQID